MSSYFENLLRESQSQDQPQRLLFLFAKAEIVENPDDPNGQQGGLITPAMCVDKLPSEISAFDALVKEADSITPEWQFIFIAGLSGQNGVAPTSDDAELYLNQMTTHVSRGEEISRYLVLDRSGDMVNMQAG